MCADNTLYTGIAVNLVRRCRQHNGELVGGAKYTAVRRPVRVIYSEIMPTRSDALRREYVIKSLTRNEKLSLCAHQ